MSKKEKMSDVEGLLEERQKLEEWLERLDLTAEDIPEPVKQRVRSDYQKRLDTVLEGLNQYAGELKSALKSEIQKRETLWKEEKQAKERLAEARLRYEVGEHEERRWQEIQAEVSEVTERVASDLESTTGEISRLEDVLSAMGKKPVPSPEKKEAKPAETAEATKKKEAVDEAEPAAKKEPSPEKPPAKKDQPSPAKAKAPPEEPAEEKAAVETEESDEDREQTDAFKKEQEGEDDLSLIKSMSSSKGGDEEEKDEIKHGVPRPSTIGEPALPAGQKTLKCAECGEMNFPTEWYCEHCGAELASL